MNRAILFMCFLAGCGSGVSADQACVDSATYAIEGKPCDTATGPACLTPARCVTAANATSGTCQLPDPITCS